MRERRGAMKDKNLTSGPGKLAIAFGITREHNGEALRDGRIWREELRKIPKKDVGVGTRIGVDYAGADAQLPLRFWVKGNAFVSRQPA